MNSQTGLVPCLHSGLHHPAARRTTLSGCVQRTTQEQTKGTALQKMTERLNLSTGLPQRDCFRGALQNRVSRGRLQIVAGKSKRKQQVVLTKNIPELGPKGTLATVADGFYRNFLLPQSLAQPATPGILANIQREKDAAEKAAQAVVAKAKAMAIALQTIGKFVIKKKVGESDQIYGSVTAQEVVNAIERQTGRVIDKRMVNLPEIKTTGTYVASVKLHPDVLGEFKVVVQKEKGTSG